jgi:hypothetical protein
MGSSTGIIGSLGGFFTHQQYQDTYHRDLIEARRIWANIAIPLKAPPPLAQFKGKESPDPWELDRSDVDFAAAVTKTGSDRQWFVNYQACKYDQGSCPYGPPADAVVASWERTNPFNPDLTNSTLTAVLGTAATAVAVTLPILLLSLLRWLGTGQWRFSWKWN